MKDSEAALQRLTQPKNQQKFQLFSVLDSYLNVCVTRIDKDELNY